MRAGQSKLQRTAPQPFQRGQKWGGCGAAGCARPPASPPLEACGGGAGLGRHLAHALDVCVKGLVVLQERLKRAALLHHQVARALAQLCVAALVALRGGVWGAGSGVRGARAGEERRRAVATAPPHTHTHMHAHRDALAPPRTDSWSPAALNMQLPSAVIFATRSPAPASSRSRASP